MVLTFSVVVVSYFLGSIPFGYLIVLLYRGEDIRRTGSGNIGATNVARSTMLGLGMATLFLDASKGLLAVTFAILISLNAQPEHRASIAVLAALSVITGHMFPVWLRFRGGKGVAAGVGAFMALVPKAVLVALGIFIAVVVVFRYVSLASIAAAGTFPGLAFLLGNGVSRFSLLVMTIASLLIIARHHENIRRLMAGTEGRFAMKGK